jgi:hypothetical protein
MFTRRSCGIAEKLADKDYTLSAKTCNQQTLVHNGAS